MTSLLGLSFDNLGEAAEIELGAVDPGDPGVGSHPTATDVLPRVLDQLEGAGVYATFFVEGLNTELYPAALGEIIARGHEVGFHAWRHEEWAKLPADVQAANLNRGLAGFEKLGIDVAGMRPPGGGLGAGGLRGLADAGLRYCSPAGAGAASEHGVAVLPFQWRHVDAACVLPPLGTVREQMAGSQDPLGPGEFVAFLEGEIDRLVAEGGFLTIVLHLFMHEWLGEGRLNALLDRLGAASRSGELEVLPLAKIADRVLADPGGFPGPVELDTTSWSS